MLNLAQIGCGYWGPNLMRNFDGLKDCEVLFCCDLEQSNLNQIKEQYPYVQTTKDFDMLVETSELDAVVIATSAKTHYDLARKALIHNKHVFVEKPLTLDLENAAELVELADQRKRKLMVGHLMEYHPAIEKLKEIIESGELGEIYYLYSQRVNLGKIRQNENALWSFAPHDLSIIMYLLDMEPEVVSASGQCYLQKDIEDVVFVNLHFPDKVMANIQLSWLDPHKIRKTTIVGSEKMAVFDDMAGTEILRIYNKGVDNNEKARSFAEAFSLRFGDINIPYIKMTEPLRLECQHFLDCIQNDQPPRSDGQDGIRVVRALKAAQQSLENSGVPVQVNMSLLKK